MAGTEYAAFDAGWLALRERVDHRSRSAGLVEALVVRWRERGPWRILDLGSGTGSNLRFVAPRIPAPQEWTLLDRDPELLGEADSGWSAVRVRSVVGDLASEGLAFVAGAHLVTASALLDLVSARWLAELVASCRAHGCAVLFSLTYDGEIRWLPGPVNHASGSAEVEPTGGIRDPLDAGVLEAVNEHQLRDKGLGPALGPGAVDTALELLRGVGYETRTAASPWRLGPGDGSLVRRLVRGWEAAAAEVRPREREALRLWADRKLRLVEEGSFEVRVGHRDILALP